MTIQAILDHSWSIFIAVLIFAGIWAERSRIKKVAAKDRKIEELCKECGRLDAEFAAMVRGVAPADGGQIIAKGCHARSGIDVAYSTETNGPVVTNNADGRRYRYLRDHGTPSWESWFQELRDGEITPEQADAEVDAAISKLEVKP